MPILLASMLIVAAAAAQAPRPAQINDNLRPAGRTEGAVLTLGLVAGLGTWRTGGSTEGTLGYRLSPDCTLRGGYQGSRSMYRPGWNHALAVSAVWSQRWW